MNELTLGNIRDFAGLNEAYQVAKLGTDNQLETRTGFLNKLGLFISTPFRWVGRAVQWAVLEPNNESPEHVATRRIQEVLVRAYGQEFLERTGAWETLQTAGQRGTGITSRELHGVFGLIDAETATVKRRNLDHASERLNHGLEERRALLSPTAFRNVRREVAAQLMVDPAVKSGSQEEINQRVTELIDAAVNRRNAIQQQRLPNLQTEITSTSSLGALKRKGLAVENSLRQVQLPTVFRGESITGLFNTSGLLVHDVEGFLSVAPLDQLEPFRNKGNALVRYLQEQRGRNQIAIDELRLLANENPQAERIQAAITSLTRLNQDLGVVEGRVTQHMVLVESLSREHPLTESLIRQGENLRDQAAVIELGKFRETAPVEQHLSIDQATQLLRQRISDRNVQGDNQTPVSLQQISQRFKSAEIFCKDIMQRVGVPHHESRFERGFIEARNRQPWTPIDQQISVELGGGNRVFRSQVVPVSQSPRVSEGQDGGETLRGKYTTDGIGGVCSDDRANTRHATNLASTELREGENLLFRGVRHGTYATKCDPSTMRPEDRRLLCQDLDIPPESTDKQIKLAVEDRRVLEGITLAVQGNDRTLQLALDNGVGEDYPTITITSVNLQTGGDGLSDSDKMSLEGNMINHQTAALNRVSQQPHVDVVVVSPDGVPTTVRVRVRVIPVNIPVNPGASWGVGSNRAEKSIREGLQQLTGSHHPGDPYGGLVGEFLSREGVPEDRKRVVRQLTEQCRGMVTNFHGPMNSDIYALAARLSLLTHMVGGTPMWNCKSGKDRTGQLDLEVKFLAARIRAEGVVPPPGPLPERLKTQLGIFAQRTGNLEIQRYNTTLAGYKTANQSTVLDRIATPSRAYYEGGRKLVAH